MRVVVDANIVFSGILNSDGKIADLLINSKKYFKYIAPNFLKEEIFKYYEKLSKLSDMSIDEVREAEFQVCQDISFISEELIKESSWVAADKLVSDIDPKDITYVAFSKHFKCKIWSGDKQLMNGLLKKGFTHFITTQELYNLREELLINNP